MFTRYEKEKIAEMIFKSSDELDDAYNAMRDKEWSQTDLYLLNEAAEEISERVKTIVRLVNKK